MALGVERVDLATLAARADYVSVHTLLNAETRGLINEVAPVPRRCGEEVARVLTQERPLHVVNPEVYAPEHRRRGP